MNALEILNKFIESGSPPDILSTEWSDGDNKVIRFEWYCGTILDLPYDGSIYDAVWKRFQEFWDAENFNALIETMLNAEAQRAQRKTQKD